MGGMTSVMQGDFSHRIEGGRKVMLEKMVPILAEDCVFSSNLGSKVLTPTLLLLEPTFVAFSAEICAF